MIRDAWWFENRQKEEDVLQADWFVPQTHFSVFFDSQGDTDIFPAELTVKATRTRGDIVVSADGKPVPVLDIKRKYEKHCDNGKKIALIAYDIVARLPDSTDENALVIAEYHTAGRYKACGQGRTRLQGGVSL